MPNLTIQIQIALAVFCACIQTVECAEVRGTVVVEYQGMFDPDSSTQTYPVSVALLPGKGQRMANRRPRVERVEVIENRMRPAFMTVQKGDRIKFINRDDVFHELFSLSPGEPVSLRLGKVSDQSSQQSLVLKQPGTTHFFCRIHSKSYARIEVVDTPYLQMVQPGHQFQFVGLAPGEWKLRLASAAGETRWIPVTAMTSPVPLNLTVLSRGGGSGAGKLGPRTGIAELYQEREQ
jgi:plastocyanin